MSLKQSIWIVASIALLVLLLVGCQGGSGVMTAGQGQVQFVISTAPDTSTAGALSAPAVAELGSGRASLQPTSRSGSQGDDDGDDDRPRRLESASAVFSSILARDLDGRLVGVTVALPVTVDLLALVDGRSVALPIGFLPPGTYDQLVVVLTGLDLVLEDGTRVTVTPPGGGWTAIIPAVPFTVVAGQVTTIELRFRPDRSFDLDGHFRFHPEFDCEHDD